MNLFGPTGGLSMSRRRALQGGLGFLASTKTTPPSAAGGPRPAISLDRFVTEEMKQAGIPGLALASAKDGRTRLVRGYGFADMATGRRVTPRTMFHIASITKTVVATALLQLAESGACSLDDPIAPSLDFDIARPQHPNTPITFRQLLMHTSSISDKKYDEVDFREAGRDARLPLRQFLVDYLSPAGRYFSAEGCFSEAAPGARWDYSNVGYALLGYLAGRLGGRDARDLIQQKIFKPLDMREVSWTIAGTPRHLLALPYEIDDGHTSPLRPIGFPDWPAGMLRASAESLIRFVSATANGGAVARCRMLASPAVDQMLTMRTLPGLPPWLTGQGLGWAEAPLDDHPRPNHWGGDPGVFTATYLDPAIAGGVLVLTNTSATPASKNAVKNICARLLRDLAS